MSEPCHVRRRSAASISLCVVGVLAIGALLGCGRVGLRLLPGASNGGGADAGCAADGCGGGVCEDRTGSAVCGCGMRDDLDSDRDGAPDCIDFCPGASDRRDDGSCTCAAANADADSDGSANCNDRCPFDPHKQAPGLCGCQTTDTDTDSDGTPDCLDVCREDRDKIAPGRCGCGNSEQDTDLDGTPDCLDRCSGHDDHGYVSDASCGVGYCQTYNTPSSCHAGKETACLAGPLLSASDATCDGVDDDCNGATDEDFVPQRTSCGVGVCANIGELACVGGARVDSCMALSRLNANDATCDARDDDCDGRTDEGAAVQISTCSSSDGSCSTTGSVACVNGALVDSCQAKMATAPDDVTCNNLDDDCNGAVDEDFVNAQTSCGSGACARTGMRTCTAGSTLDTCEAANPTTAVDDSCNGSDDDCDGRSDEEFVAAATSCGNGVCAAAGTLRCNAGVMQDSCVAKARTTTVDDAALPGNGLDDDCDGKVDEDLPTCDSNPRSYEAGAHAIAIPGNCHTVSVRLWGAGGASGQSEGLGAGGDGGAGGYAATTVLVAGSIDLYVAGPAASGCNDPGSNAGSSIYNGGVGGTSTGGDGADGAVSGGGSGGAPSSGARGGNGYYGGGGGGQGNGGLGASGSGGGGGAASVFIVNGVRAAIAGGGGGGGGAQSLSIVGTLAAAGGGGGAGCRGNGQAPNANGGGGGGGGVCQGASTQSGSGRTPAFSGELPSGRAEGGTGSCGAAGAGYAIVTFGP